MPTHKVNRYRGGDLGLETTDPNYRAWFEANARTNNGACPDLADLCFKSSSRLRAQQGSGASYGTCFAIAEHFDAARSVLMYKFGHSGLILELEGEYRTTTGRTVRTLRGHAEISALAQAIDSVALPDNDYAHFLTRLYVELSPCPQCVPQLAPYAEHTVVMYSYTYGVVPEMGMWESDNQAGIHGVGGRFR